MSPVFAPRDAARGRPSWRAARGRSAGERRAVAPGGRSCGRFVLWDARELHGRDLAGIDVAMGTVVVVDVGIGNLRSVQKALERAAGDAGLAWKAEITPDPDDILRADKVVVPGQGAFRDCAVALRSGVADAIRRQIEKGTLFFGICMGLQTLFRTSEEAPGYEGLAIFEGTNVRLSNGQRDPATG